ncbi:MAG: NAD(P)H-dependent glycerol-3-phosphate dehydrogenase [Planctomycetota bacterium]|jgi:glycerol-3-phosphate dehydrogenase (NAD(P)+)
MTQQVAIIGDGQMGLVMADALAACGVGVRLWGPFAKDMQELAATRRSPARLESFELPESVEVTADDAQAFEDVGLVLNAIPTQFIRSVWQRLGPHCPAGTPVACVSKGIENETLLAPTQVIADTLGESHDGGGRAYCALSGPTIAAELARRLPATMVAASTDKATASLVQETFGPPWMRIYTSDDLLGVELAGATKNVIALAAGMIDGLEAGANAKSALLARGLAEIARLGTSMGARIDTFFGIAGVGDLATTCFSPFGRNRTCGERLGQGESLQDIIQSTVSVIEGIPTTRSVVALAARQDVDMPITQAVYGILFEQLSPVDAIRRLMQRERKPERIG